MVDVEVILMDSLVVKVVLVVLVVVVLSVLLEEQVEQVEQVTYIHQVLLFILLLPLDKEIQVEMLQLHQTLHMEVAVAVVLVLLDRTGLILQAVQVEMAQQALMHTDLEIL